MRLPPVVVSVEDPAMRQCPVIVSDGFAVFVAVKFVVVFLSNILDGGEEHSRTAMI